jgi:hypothetical protein
MNIALLLMVEIDQCHGAGHELYAVSTVRRPRYEHCRQLARITECCR